MLPSAQKLYVVMQYSSFANITLRKRELVAYFNRALAVVWLLVSGVLYLFLTVLCVSVIVSLPYRSLRKHRQFCGSFQCFPSLYREDHVAIHASAVNLYIRRVTNMYLISQPKLTLLVLKRTVSLRRFF